MRTSAAVLSFGLGIAVPCIVAVWGIDAPMQFYLTLGGASFGVGLVIASVLDIADWRADSKSLLRQRESMTDATEAATAERWAKLNAPASPAVPQVDPKLQAKALAVETFFRAGDKAGGFSEGKLAGCVGSDHGPWLRHFYMSEAGGEWLQDKGGNKGTDWNEGRDLQGLLTVLRAGVLPLPPGPVPDVRALPDSAAQRRTPQKSNRQAVIDA